MARALEEIIASLALATEGSRELDAHIAATCKVLAADAPDWLKNWEGLFEARDYKGNIGWLVIALYPPGSKLDGHAGNWRPPHFTTSIDDALTLVPDGHRWRWLVDKRPFGHQRQDGYRAHVWNGTSVAYDDTQMWLATPAIALSAAALKARLLHATVTARIPS